MGYSLDDALSDAGTFNRTFGNTKLPDMNETYGIQNKAVTNITQGYNNYVNGKWTKADTIKVNR